MSYNNFRKPALLSAALLFIVFAVPSVAKTGTEADLTKKKVIHTIEVRRETQKKEDAWAEKKDRLTARYASLKNELDSLEKMKIRIGQQLRIQQEFIAEAGRKKRESERINEELQAYLESVVTRLEEFIKRDIPFLNRERADRIASIKETLTDPGRSGAEKYRRVMEALRIETEYGGSVDVYQETIEFDGQSVLVDVLRLGRLSLFCQNPDGKITGVYDSASRSWVPLSSGYQREISKAISMARRERSIDMVKLPAGRIDIP